MRTDVEEPQRRPPAAVLYLASTSPRRTALLAAAGMRAIVVPPGPEPTGSGEPRQRARQRARAKAVGAHVDGAPGWVIGVDTVVALGSEEFGKPRDRGDAARLLQRLAARTHTVHTAVCARAHPAARGILVEAVADASVRCRAFSEAELEAYLASDDWQGKAGAYGIQDATQTFMELVTGEIDTVIGLPLQTLRDLLAAAEERQA